MVIYDFTLNERSQLKLILYDNAGTELYSRNLKLLVPFFDCPSIALQKIEKVVFHYNVALYFFCVSNTRRKQNKTQALQNNPHQLNH